MSRNRLRRRVAAASAACLALSSVVPAQAAPIDTTSTTGYRIQTVPALNPAGGATEISNTGMVVLGGSNSALGVDGKSIWLGNGRGYPITDIGCSFCSTNPNFVIADVNSSGDVVGTWSSGGTGYGFVWSESDGYRQGLISGTGAKVVGIDDDGNIVGYLPSTPAGSCGNNSTTICMFYGNASGMSVVPDSSGQIPLDVGGGVVAGASWTWSVADGFVPLPTTSAAGQGRAINEAHEVAGFVTDDTGGLTAAYWASPTASATVIGVLPGLGHTQSFAAGINELGQVVGWSGTSSSTSSPRRAFVWTPPSGPMVDLGLLPGGTTAAAFDINDDGIVVGTADNTSVTWDVGTTNFDVDYPPLIASSTYVQATAGDLVEFPLVVDDLDGDPFTLTLSGEPAGMTWDPATKNIVWQTSAGDLGTYRFDISVVQDDRPENRLDFPGTVVLSAPLTLDPIGDQAAKVGELFSFTATSSAVFPAGYASYEAFAGTPAAPAALPAGAAMGRFTGVFTWTPVAGQEGDHVITVGVEDLYATFQPTVYETFTITVTGSSLTIFVDESIGVADDVTVSPAVQIAISESVGVSDGVEARVPILISITESVGVADDVSVSPALQIMVSESVGVSDDATALPEPPGRVSGTTWVDLDGDGTRDGNEPGLAGVTVYLDTNLNSKLDAADPRVVSGKTGSYVLSNVLPGSRRVRVAVPTGHDLTKPTQWYTVPVVSGATATGRDFGLDPNGSDGDSDGLVGAVDGTFASGFVSARATSSNNFTDRHRAGGTTSGVVLDRAGLDLSVSDADPPDRGVRIVTANEPVEAFADFRFCGRPEVIGVRDGSSATLTCGSLLIEVDAGLVTAETADNAVVTVGAGSKVLIDEVGGAVTVESLAGPASITANGVTTTLAAGEKILNPGGPAPGSELDLAAAFVPLSPVRLFDTRPTEPGFGPKGKVAADSSIDVQVGGRVDIPDDAVAVVMNVTVAEPEGPSFVTAYPAGSERPLASSVNIVEAGQVRPNLVTVKLGDDGKVTLYTLAASHLLADVAGYYTDADAAVAGGRFVPLTPQRLFDTRADQPAPGPKGKLGADDTVVVQALGVGDVPATGVAALVINVTATEAEAAGFVTAYPTGEPRPVASNVNLDRPGATAPNLAIVPIGDGGTISFYSLSAAHLLGDVTGYITDATADVSTDGLFVPLEPARVFDTREAESPPGPKGYVPADGSIDVDVAGVAGVPDDAAGVVLNVTGAASPLGFLTAWERGPSRPVASTLNFAAPLDTRANAAMLPVGVGGQISFYTLNGSDMLADVAGYFLG